MNEPCNRLKRARERAGYESAANAARRYGWSEVTYRAHENGLRGITPRVAEKYGRAFRVDPSWLLYGTGDETPDSADSSPPKVSKVTGQKGVPSDAIVEPDLRGGMGGGGASVLIQDTDGNGLGYAAEGLRDYWRIPDWFLKAHGNVRPQHLVALSTQGDSMEPRIMDGDIVFIDLRHTVPSPPGIYALADGFGGIVIKRLEVISRPGEEPVRVLLKSDNPNHSEREWTLDEIHIIGRYIARVTPF